MGTTECCKLNKESEMELRAEKSSARLFNQRDTDGPDELDRRFERLIEVFPFALNRIVVTLLANPANRRNATLSTHFPLRNAGTPLGSV